MSVTRISFARPSTVSRERTRRSYDDDHRAGRGGILTGLDLTFSGELWHWRGPAPWYFVTVPEEESFDLHAVSSAVTYGWGMIPVLAGIGTTTWETSLFPKDGLYVVPVKAMVRRAEDLDESDTVTVRLWTS